VAGFQTDSRRRVDMSEVVIVSGVRTAIGALGALWGIGHSGCWADGGVEHPYL